MNIAATAKAVEPVAEPAIDESTLALATEHVGKALGADGAEGANAYSINCWASLERSFALATADRCAAFDALTLAKVGNDPLEDLTWFAERPVSLRYAQALSDKAPEVADAAERLERLRVAAAVRKVVLVVAKVTAVTAPTNSEDSVDLDMLDDEMSNLAVSVE